MLNMLLQEDLHFYFASVGTRWCLIWKSSNPNGFEPPLGNNNGVNKLSKIGHAPTIFHISLSRESSGDPRR
ncbi:hypothetical protein CYMTET_26580 [Cymbomonas tetramitiformis]|uniref:Uncharacterized protein n=1 Tax=Cymbomonas tetramitiformis TaxID=36881 RepID=A0AAE0FRS8_9CHLO|nr:hypothetical protein CYMTET_26580 [Cymbomonas tetramitiformis]